MDASKVLIIGATGYYGIYLSKDSFFSESLKISRRKKGKIKNLIQLDINKENLIEKIGNSNLDFVINLSRANPDSSNEEHIKFNENSIKNIVDFCNNHSKKKTFLTQEMLKNKILATNMIYITIFHTKDNIKKYIKTLDKVFYDISKNNIKTILKSKVCFKPINRIN